MTAPANHDGRAVRPRGRLELAVGVLSALGLVAAVLALVAGLGGLLPAATMTFIGFGLLALTLESRRTGSLTLRYGRVTRLSVRLMRPPAGNQSRSKVEVPG